MSPQLIVFVLKTLAWRSGAADTFSRFFFETLVAVGVPLTCMTNELVAKFAVAPIALSTVAAIIYYVAVDADISSRSNRQQVGLGGK